MEIECRNVNEAYVRGMHVLNSLGKIEDSRNGPVIVLPEPMLTIYNNPMERVLFHPGRDANPFFHLFEAMWMLAGRNDVAFLSHYAEQMKQYSDDDKTLYGAYGWRWEHEVSQLSQIVNGLKSDPTSRRAVLTMWNKADLFVKSKDIPCNTHCYFRVRGDALDMTVCCRSNDIIWGAYGANAVHFSILQEFVASRLHLAVGKMYQFSNNYHAYTGLFDEKFRSIDEPFLQYGILQVTPIVTGEWSFIHELKEVLDVIEHKDRLSTFTYHNPFLIQLVGLAGVWDQHRVRKDTQGALDLLKELKRCDWTIACEMWLTRRLK
jgi:hypothetical protein